MATAHTVLETVARPGSVSGVRMGREKDVSRANGVAEESKKVSSRAVEWMKVENRLGKSMGRVGHGSDEGREMDVTLCPVTVFMSSDSTSCEGGGQAKELTINCERKEMQLGRG